VGETGTERNNAPSILTLEQLEMLFPKACPKYSPPSNRTDPRQLVRLSESTVDAPWSANVITTVCEEARLETVIVPVEYTDPLSAGAM
jgi:hypothetical protein